MAFEIETAKASMASPIAKISTVVSPMIIPHVLIVREAAVQQKRLLAQFVLQVSFPSQMKGAWPPEIPEYVDHTKQLLPFNLCVIVPEKTIFVNSRLYFLIIGCSLEA